MKPLNTKERNSTFWSFVLFFTLAVGLITLTIYFTFTIPHKQFAELKAKVKNYDAFMAKQKGYMNQIDTINYSLQQYNMPGANQSYIQNDISKKNIALEEAIGEENETNRVYHKIIANYKNMLKFKADLNDVKQSLIESNNFLNDCESENRRVEKELKEKQDKKQ